MKCIGSVGFHASGCWCASVAEGSVLSVKVALEETWQQTGLRLGMWLPDRGVLRSEGKVSVWGATKTPDRGGEVGRVLGEVTKQ